MKRSEVSRQAIWRENALQDATMGEHMEDQANPTGYWKPWRDHPEGHRASSSMARNPGRSSKKDHSAAGAKSSRTRRAIKWSFEVPTMGRGQRACVLTERDWTHRQVPTAVCHIAHSDDPKKPIHRKAHSLSECPSSPAVQAEKRTNTTMAKRHPAQHGVGKSTSWQSVLMDSHQAAHEGRNFQRKRQIRGFSALRFEKFLR